MKVDSDRRRSALITELDRALTTPIDRDDLFRLSRSIDDVLDNLRDFGREVELYQPAAIHTFQPLLTAIHTALEALRDAVGHTSEQPESIAWASKDARRQGNEIRRSYEERIAALLTEELTMETLRERELLRRLDVVGLRLGEAIDALADGALKRSP